MSCSTSLLTFNLIFSASGTQINAISFTFKKMAQFVYDRAYAILGYQLSTTMIHSIAAPSGGIEGVAVVLGTIPANNLIFLGTGSNNVMAVHLTNQNTNVTTGYYNPQAQVSTVMFLPDHGIVVKPGDPVTLMASAPNDADSIVSASLILYTILIK